MAVETTDGVWRVSEVARKLGVSSSHVHNEIAAGKLKAFQSGSLKLINSEALDAYRGLEPGRTSTPVASLPPPPRPNSHKRGPGRPRKEPLEPPEAIAADAEDAQEDGDEGDFEVPAGCLDD